MVTNRHSSIHHQSSQGKNEEDSGLIFQLSVNYTSKFFARYRQRYIVKPS